MCPGKSARSLPTPSHTLGSLAQEAPPSKGERNKSCLWEPGGRPDQPGTGAQLGPWKVRTESGRTGVGSWDPLGHEQDFREGLRVPGKEPGKFQEGEGHPAGPKGGWRQEGGDRVTRRAWWDQTQDRSHRDGTTKMHRLPS